MPARSRVARRLLARNQAVTRTFQQIERYPREWRQRNEDALAGAGPLWVVLGDSAALGVGATASDRGYVGLVRDSLERRDGVPWRVVNLAACGATTRDVLDRQLLRLAGLPRPQLLSAVVGGNDLIGTPVRWWLRDIEELAATLPRGTVLATVPRGLRARKARRANAALRLAAGDHGHRLADIWAVTGPPWRGAYVDGMHPSDQGYRLWASALCLALADSRGAPRVAYCR